MFRLALGLITFAAIASSPMPAFAAGARSQTFDEIVAEKIVDRFAAGDMRVRVTPVANVCGNQGEGYKVDVLLKVVHVRADGQKFAQLVHVKTYGAIERIFMGPKIIECAVSDPSSPRR